MTNDNVLLFVENGVEFVLISKNKLASTFIKLKLNNNICENIYVTIMSNSMYPTLKRGQQVLVYPIKDELKISDIILYMHWEKSLTIHRIVDIIRSDNYGKLYFTKGDNNTEIDRYTITDKDIIGIIK